MKPRAIYCATFLTLVFVLIALASGVSAAGSLRSPSIFAPASTLAIAIFDLSLLVFAITVGIFVVTQGILLYIILRFRHRKNDNREPPQVYGGRFIKVAWTVVPLLIALVLFLVTVRSIGELERSEASPGSIKVTVVGHQWWWNSGIRSWEWSPPMSCTSPLVVQTIAHLYS